MARPGVTFSEVDRAAKKVLEQGQRPTVDRVIAITGGSRTTVNAHLKLWWAKHDQQMDAEQAGLPSHLVEAVKALNEKAHETAEQKLMEAKTRFETEITRLRQEALEQRTKADQLEKQLHILQEQFEALSSDNGSLKQDLEHEKLARYKLEETLSSTKLFLEEAKKNHQERQIENRDIRAHFEHYQQRIAEDRQHEREQFRITRTSLEQQVDLLHKQLQAAEKRWYATQEERDELLALQETSDVALEELKQNMSVEETKNFTLQQTIMQQEQALMQSNDALKTQLELHRQLQTEHQQVCRQQAAQQQKLDLLEQQWKECCDRVSVLSDENRALLQEKAMLQGQLKQIQSTL